MKPVGSALAPWRPEPRGRGLEEHPGGMGSARSSKPRARYDCEHTQGAKPSSRRRADAEVKLTSHSHHCAEQAGGWGLSNLESTQQPQPRLIH